MAGNFWQSSHCNQWLLDYQVLMNERQKDLKLVTEEEYQKIMIFFANVTQAIGEQLKVRQQVIATATMYLKRIYARHSLKCIDPLLAAPTCVLLASKVEEHCVITNNRLLNACQNVVKKFGYAFKNREFPFKVNQIQECEFYLLEIMIYFMAVKCNSTSTNLLCSRRPFVISWCDSTNKNDVGEISSGPWLWPVLDCCLIVYHPYRPLVQYVSDLDKDEPLLPLAWKIVNDSLRTDVCLLYPPYLIALACLHMACVISQKDIKQWFAELNVDLDKILEITQQILKLYDLWKNYEEREEISAILQKIPKPVLTSPASSSN